MVKINRKWAVVTCLMALLIWGNSLVPGSGSGSLSLTVMEAIRGFLHRSFYVFGIYINTI